MSENRRSPSELPADALAGPVRTDRGTLAWSDPDAPELGAFDEAIRIGQGPLAGPPEPPGGGTGGRPRRVRDDDGMLTGLDP